MILLRSTLFYLLFLVSIAGISIILWLVPKVVNLSPWDLVRVWGHFLNRALWVICRVRVEVRGTPPDGLEPTLIVANHTGPWETVALQPLLSEPFVYVVKKQLLQWHYNFFALGIRALKPIPISRENNAGDLERILDGSKKHFEENRQVLIFPEGTRRPVGQCVEMSPGGALLAKRLKCRLQIVFIDSEVWARGKMVKDFGMVSPGVIRVRFGPLFTSREVQETKVKTLHEKAMSFYEQCLTEKSAGKNDPVSCTRKV